MNILTTGRKPIKMWLDDIEDGAREQAENLSNLPFIFKHIALMPDCHQGYGMPIGGVMATRGVIIPNAVGVDIGCGMCAVKTSLTEIDIESLKKIMGHIRETIPVGFKKHSHQQGQMPESYGRTEIVRREYDNATKSLGTLGGGNHFIEIQRGDDGFIWIMIHSGSRNLGKQVADHYNKVAVGLNEKWRSEVPKEWELAFLPLDSDEGQAYLSEMQYCVAFALANRRLMMDRILDCFADKSIYFDVEQSINIAHNYAAMENHFNTNVMVHRKGATKAAEGQFGIIPGSQGTSSYIVKGKGNHESFQSCSHGAGRRMGRKQAQRELSLEDEQKHLDAMNVIHSVRTEKDLDESPGAYKDIDIVMSNQSDLVDVVVKLTPLAVIKG